MNRDEILKELYECEFVEKYTREKLKQQDYLDDYIQEVWQIICEIPEKKLVELYKQENSINGVRKYVAGIICRTVHSQTSGAYMKLIKRDARNITIKISNDKKLKYDEEQGWI